MLRFGAESGNPAEFAVGGLHVLLSIPTLRVGGCLQEPTPRLVRSLLGVPVHATYISTTGVYGDARTVDERTEAVPRTERQQLRIQAERAVRQLACKTAVLRPAAIYGPGRGVHSRMRSGTFPLPAGRARMVSRIHVDDLAAIVAASMCQRVEGVYPVADDLPASSVDVASFCSSLMGLPLPDRVPVGNLPETRRADRRVDGSAIRRLTGVRLRYPTYREGITACLAEEAAC